MGSPMSFNQRTQNCGVLRLDHAGQTVTLNGWAHRVRDLGGLLFIDLRDRTGLVQLFIDPSKVDGSAIRTESCLSITGVVKEREEKTKNANMETGEIEIVVTSFEILGQAKPLPFPLNDESQMKSVNEELRIKYRYLDLRRPAMYMKLALRASAVTKMRSFLDRRGFIETETPIFTKSTPEGARDYLVPYRLEPGLFYALPQSPQQYKQILMVAGFERYYQVAKCFRDEAQRSDRQPEFTQLDIEMSFVTQEDILEMMESLTLEVINGLIEDFNLDKEKVEPFVRMTYDESMARYGCDKPDLRFGLELFDVTEVLSGAEFGVFKSAIESGGKIRGVRFPGGASLSRKDVTAVEDYCKEFGAKGMASIAITSESAGSDNEVALSNGLFAKAGFLKFLTPAEIEGIASVSQAEAGDLLCFIADEYSAGNNILYRLRNEIGQRCGLRDPRKLKFSFIIDFPLVEWNADARRWDSMHHPFTSPKASDFQYLDTDPGKIRADCYDVVCNGVEWASGSIRIHQPEVQARIFSLLGIDEERQKERFGHILEAFSYGAPPHGGIAPGIDRLIMFLLNEENIREVIAFPKIGMGQDPLMDSPSTIDPQQWAELGLRKS
jgi:aspartyl-tRNA synthetase